MSKALAMVRRRLNSHSPVIRKIPPEILIMIASHFKLNAAIITKATHVCHDWRVTLLSCPGLWTHPDFALENQASLFLRRSEPLPIHVDLTKTFSSHYLIGLLCLHSTRVCTLRIGCFDGLHELFHQPLASLRTLEVATPDEWFQAQAVRSTAREFVALVSLTVHNTGALGFRGSHITHLRIAIPHLASEVTQIPGLFRTCVLLEELEVENESGLESGLRLIPDEVIPLPHLRSFTQTLHCDKHMAGIIDNLHLPPSCSVVLRCVRDMVNGYPRPSLPDCRNTSYITNAKRAKVAYAEGHRGRKASVTFDFIGAGGTRFTAITEFVNYAIDLSDEGHTNLRVGLTMSGIEVLCLYGHKYVSLESYKSLTTLIISGPVVHLYLRSLEESELRDACESLHTFVLFVPPDPFMSSLVRRLLNISHARAKAGLPFRTVTFAHPFELAPDDLKVLEGLRGCVGRVELLLGDDTLDWNLDKYFLNGL